MIYCSGEPCSPIVLVAKPKRTNTHNYCYIKQIKLHRISLILQSVKLANEVRRYKSIHRFQRIKTYKSNIKIHQAREHGSPLQNCNNINLTTTRKKSEHQNNARIIFYNIKAQLKSKSDCTNSDYAVNCCDFCKVICTGACNINNCVSIVATAL